MIPDADTPVGASPLIVHVHVPKTAGSAINAHLRQHAGPGRDHVENGIAGIEGAAWISGHVPLPEMQRIVGATGRRARYLTALREPVAQVVSHYNWLIEIGRRGEAFLNGHPAHIREIHHRIAATDNTSAAAIIGNLEAWPGLFLNCQARFALGPDFAHPGLSYRARLASYDCLVDSACPEAGLRDLLGMAPLARQVANRSVDHFDRSVFRNPAMLEFLADANRHDAALWAVAGSRLSGDSPASLREAV